MKSNYYITFTGACKSKTYFIYFFKRIVLRFNNKTINFVTPLESIIH